MSALDFMKLEYEKTQNRIKYAERSHQDDLKKKYEEQAGCYYEAILALRMQDSMRYPDHLSWSELRRKKSKPIFIRDKNQLTGDWFGWWDILDTIDDEKIQTAYGEEFYKDSKGEKWDAFEYEIKTK